MHWGDASKAQPAANTAVWTGYAGVWHMGKASGAETEPDMTGHELDATPHASTHTDCVGDTDLMIAEADGLTGGCRTNTVEETKANALVVSPYKSKLTDFGYTERFGYRNHAAVTVIVSKAGACRYVRILNFNGNCF